MTGEDIMKFRMDSERSLKEIIMIERRGMAAPKKRISKFRGENERVLQGEVHSSSKVLKRHSLSWWSRLIRELKNSARADRASIYSHFTRKTPHTMYFGT